MQSIPYKICYSTVYHTFGEKYAQRFVRNRGDFYRFANVPLPERILGIPLFFHISQMRAAAGEAAYFRCGKLFPRQRTISAIFGSLSPCTTIYRVRMRWIFHHSYPQPVENQGGKTAYAPFRIAFFRRTSVFQQQFSTACGFPVRILPRFSTTQGSEDAVLSLRRWDLRYLLTFLRLRDIIVVECGQSA